MMDRTAPLHEFLPPGCREKFDHLTDQRSDASAAARAAADVLERAHAARADAEADVQRIAAEDSHTDQRAGGSDTLQRAKARLAAKTEAVAVAKRRYDERQERLSEYPDPAPWLVQFADALRAGRTRHVTVTHPGGATIASTRALIVEIDAKIAEAETAPAPDGDLKREAAAELDRLIVPPLLDRRIRGRDPFKLAEALQLTPQAVPHGVAMVGDGGKGLLLWVLRDEILAKLFAEIGTDDLPGTLTDAERDKLLAKQRAAKLSFERVEEQLIMQAEEVAGQRIVRRPDANPLAVLELGVID